MRGISSPYQVDILGKKIIVFPHVFYPAIDTKLVIQSVHVKPTERILEPFAGTGAISIFLASTALSVIATDVNPFAIKNIDENIQLHKLEEKVKAVNTDIFPKNGEKFDVIVANPPYSDYEAKDLEEKAMWDKNHEAVRRFFQKAREYLTSGGRIYCTWSNFADFEFLKN